ncbi:hypothetical protein [Mucilaginibacter sp.]|uniref:hypothetical protein n=1 Tax=Mucilaginibacter sp. TaxID=1882438 RepID=UPI003AFF7B20
MQVSEIQLFQILKEKVGEEQAKTLTEYVEAKIEKQFEIKKDGLASKQDIAELKIEISNVRNELKLEIGDLKIELKTDIANSRSDTIKWMFLFLFGQLAAIYAIVEIILKK